MKDRHYIGTKKELTRFDSKRFELEFILSADFLESFEGLSKEVLMLLTVYRQKCEKAIELEKELIELRMFRMLANDANPNIEIDIANHVNQSPRG